MDLFVYSDESGVFDYVHNDYYVFGGLLLIGKENKDIASRKYSAAERTLRKSGGYQSDDELKAAKVTNSEKSKLYRSLNQHYKFAVVIDQRKINRNIFNEKKSKQRYLDYAYKLGLKALLKVLLRDGIIKSDSIDVIRVFPDEHTTATNGKYELREGLLQEYKHGTFNDNYNVFYKPILPDIKSLDVTFCNSSSVTLVRAADIIANHVYYYTITGKLEQLRNNEHLIITELP